MAESRFTGLALGKFANFFATSNNVFSQGDTTPDVTNGVLFFSNNTTNTTITHFDLTATQGGNVSQFFEGKMIQVVFLDDSTGLANTGRLVLSSSDSLAGANNSITLIYHNSSWIETSRSVNVSNAVNIQSSNLGGAGIVNAQGRDTIILLAAAASNAVLRRATNGYQGQVLRVAATGSHCLIIVNSAANDTFVVTSSTGAVDLLMASSEATSFVRVGAQWLEIADQS